MDLTVYDLPLSGNLSIIETTEGINGYPKNTAYGVVGFKSFEDAESFAKEHGLQVVSFVRRDGHHFWQNEGWRTEPYNQLEEYLQDENYHCFYGNIEELAEEIAELYKGVISDITDFREMESIFNTFKDLYNEVESLDNDCFIATDASYKNYELFDKKTMVMYCDVYRYQIGVF